MNDLELTRQPGLPAETGASAGQDIAAAMTKVGAAFEPLALAIQRMCEALSEWYEDHRPMFEQLGQLAEEHPDWFERAAGEEDADELIEWFGSKDAARWRPDALEIEA